MRDFIIGLCGSVLASLGVMLILQAGSALIQTVNTAGCGDTPRAECLERNIR